MIWLVVIGLALWAILGSPSTDVADWFWKDQAAPWEEVDAFYYPDRNNLTVHEQLLGVGTVGNCRTVIRSMAAANGDPLIERGDYECGVGRMDKLGSVYVYRLTIR